MRSKFKNLFKRIFRRKEATHLASTQVMEIHQGITQASKREISEENKAEQNQNRKKEIKKIKKYVLHEPKL